MSAIDGVYFNHNGLTKTIEITNPTTGYRIRVGGFEYRTLVDQRVIDPNNLSPYDPREAIVNSYTNIIDQGRSRIPPGSYVTSDPISPDTGSYAGSVPFLGVSTRPVIGSGFNRELF